MRLLITADLHYNHPRSRGLADTLIDEMNTAGGDVLLVIGDTAVADGDNLEQCLSRFRFSGPKLFVAGNHDLWTHGPDSHQLFAHDLPRRVEALGWQWLETLPFIANDVAVVGSVGWYDYSFARPELQIPRRFYENKISPGAAEHLTEYALLLGDDVSPTALRVVARWNDGRHIKLHRSDEQFLIERLAQLEQNLSAVESAKRVIAAIHHLPFRELLPGPRIPQWDFAHAYLGSDRIGDVIGKFPNVRHVYCGHSHLPIEAKIGPIHAINIGSGYRWKTYRTLDL